MTTSPFAGARYRRLGHDAQPGPPSVAAHLAAVREWLEAHPDDQATGCPCGETDDLPLVDVDRNGLPLRLVLCRQCGIIRVDPQPDDASLAWFYRHHYRAIYGPHVAGDVLYETYAWKGRLIDEVLGAAGVEIDAAVLVDLGCGGGWALRAAGGAACTRIGYDFDEDYLAAGRARGMDLRRGDAAQALRDGVVADVLIAAHVLEHVRDPVAWLGGLRPLVGAGGVLYLEVPHLRRIRSSLWCDARRYWQRAHLWDFQRAHVEVLARRAGWRPIHSSEDALSVELVCKPSEPQPDLPLPRLGRQVEEILRRNERRRRSPFYRARKAACHGARRFKRTLLGPRR